jgi:hypothetical protein
MVKEVVERYGGWVRLSGRDGQAGSVFSVFLPAEGSEEVATLSTSA